MNYTVICKNGTNVPVEHQLTYPFQLDSTQTAVNVTCSDKLNKTETVMAYPLGNYRLESQLFVLTGVGSFLLAAACLVLYIFSSCFSNNWTKVADILVTVLFVAFWMSASTAWAISVVHMKFTSDPTNWIYRNSNMNNSICLKSSNNNYISPVVSYCMVESAGLFAEANVSVIFGFLNVFLWSSNIWFLYKETHWCTGYRRLP